MVDHGADLGVDLYKLLVVAKDDLPSVSAVYTDTVKKYDHARSAVDTAMARPEHFGGALGPVHAAWGELHDVAGKVLRETRRNLDDTAAVLSTAVRLYESHDQGAARKLKQLRADRGEPGPGG